MATEGAEPLSREAAEFAGQLREWMRRLDDDETEAAARNLKPFACGEELYYERFGRSDETQRIYNEAVPRERISFLAREELLTDEARGRLLDAAEREHLFRQLSGHYRKVGAIQTALRAIEPDSPYPVWIRVGWALKHELAEEGFWYWDSWSRRGGKYPGESELRHLWDRSGDHPNPVTLGSMLHFAKGGARG